MATNDNDTKTAAFHAAAVIDGDYRPREVAEALRTMRFTSEDSVRLVAIDKPVRDFLVSAVERQAGRSRG